MNNNYNYNHNINRALPTPEGLEEPYMTAYLEFSRQTKELMLNPKQIYVMHVRKKMKLLEQQKHPERIGMTRESAKKKDKTKSRSIFASNRERDSKGRFFSKNSQETPLPLHSKTGNTVNIQNNELGQFSDGEMGLEREHEFTIWDNPIPSCEFDPFSMGLVRWDSSQQPNAFSSAMMEEFFFDQ